MTDCPSYLPERMYYLIITTTSTRRPLAFHHGRAVDYNGTESACSGRLCSVPGAACSLRKIARALFALSFLFSNILL